MEIEFVNKIFYWIFGTSLGIIFFSSWNIHLKLNELNKDMEIIGGSLNELSKLIESKTAE